MAPLWTQRQDIGPAARSGHAMAFDAARGRTVLFGGIVGGAALNDTWEWDGQHWTQTQDIGPPPRSLTALAFDSQRGRTVLFGGEGNAGAFLGDTWEWDGSEWTQMQDVGPSARTGHTMAFDSQHTLAFGGWTSGGPSGDTWQWDGTAWTQIDDIGPPPRTRHAMAHAVDRSRTVLFGGNNGGGAALSDTWEWDSKRWSHVQDIGPARDGSAIAFTGATTTLFGGWSTTTAASPAAVFGDTWEWDGQHWADRQDMGPQARWLHALAFDSTRSRLVLFGGTTALDRDTSLGDTWELDNLGAESNVVLASLDVSSIGGSSFQGHLVLSAPAPSEGIWVNLSANPSRDVGMAMNGSPIQGPPWPVQIPWGSTTVVFQGSTTPNVGGGGTVITFTATSGAVTKTASVTLA